MLRVRCGLAQFVVGAAALELLSADQVAATFLTRTEHDQSTSDGPGPPSFGGMASSSSQRQNNAVLEALTRNFRSPSPAPMFEPELPNLAMEVKSDGAAGAILDVTKSDGAAGAILDITKSDGAAGAILDVTKSDGAAEAILDVMSRDSSDIASDHVHTDAAAKAEPCLQALPGSIVPDHVHGMWNECLLAAAPAPKTAAASFQEIVSAAPAAGAGGKASSGPTRCGTGVRNVFLIVRGSWSTRNYTLGCFGVVGSLAIGGAYGCWTGLAQK